MKYLFKLMKQFNTCSAKGKEKMLAQVIALLANMLEEYIESYPEENTQAKKKLYAHLMSIMQEENQ